MDSNTSRSLFRLRIHHLHNGTYLASVIDETHHYNTSTVQNEYDDTGALYYVIAVVLMYGCSIILMIGSSIKKSKNDNGVHKYMKDMDKIKRLARRQEKFKTRLVMYGKRYRNVLGSDRAELSVDGSCERIPEVIEETDTSVKFAGVATAGTKPSVHFAVDNPTAGTVKTNPVTNYVNMIPLSKVPEHELEQIKVTGENKVDSEHPGAKDVPVCVQVT